MVDGGSDRMEYQKHIREGKRWGGKGIIGENMVVCVSSERTLSSLKYN